VTISLGDTIKPIKKETPECELEAKVLSTEESGISSRGNPILRRALGRSIAASVPAASPPALVFSLGTQ
jgi:hypothetical protein